MTPFRLNLIIIAGFIAIICIGIMVLIGKAMASLMGDSSTGAFVLGALIGLLGSGITGLTSLGTTLLNDSKSDGKNSKSDENSG